MVTIKAWWNAFKNVAILFSFIMNFILVLVLLFVVLLIFQIKNGIAEPLIVGLHSSFVGLDQARILTTINVRDTITVSDVIPVKLNIPLQQNTVVVLTENVPIRANTSFTLRDGTTLNGVVNISLPAGLRLPVALNLNVPVDSTLPINIKVPINLSVPVDIPLSETQLHDPFDKMRALLDPFVRLLGNLPSNWGEVWPFVGRILGGNPPNLMASNQYVERPWPGFSTGLGTPIPTATTVPGTGGPVGPTPQPGEPTTGAGGETTPVAPVATTPPGPAVSPTPVKDLGIITPAR
jgi:hypothetical protein